MSIQGNNIIALITAGALVGVADAAVVASDPGEIDSMILGRSDYFLEIFGEQITYYPAGGGSRSIKGIIDRGSFEDYGDDMVQSPTFSITVANDNTTGISSAELNTGGDAIAFPMRRGDSDSTKRIVAIVTQNAEMIKVEMG